MKRFSTILMALVLALGLTQCKKNETTTTTTTTIDTPTEGVAITLKVQGNQGGTKADVNPTTGSVDYAIGDQVHVASAGKYVGTLTYDGNVFAGSIANAVEGQPLQFYFLGNVTPDEELTSGVTESCSVVITDQTEHLPVISAAPSVENYSGLNPDYTARLLNKCALVKFNVTTNSDGPTSLTGFNNKVTVNFMENTFDYGMTNNGTITMPAGDGERWAILLPQAAMEAGDVGSVRSTSSNGEYKGTRDAVPAIYANAFFTTGISVNVSTYCGPVGSISGKFSVGANQQVFFSKGNLQYIGSAGNGDANNTGAYWKFADNQWNYLGNNGQGSVNKTVDRDLFGWCTSGYNHGTTCYQPWSTGDYWYDYEVGIDMAGQADWGYNAIANGGNQENMGWHTLSRAEWAYLISARPYASSKWGCGDVNGVKGIILLPDEWTLPEGLNFTAGATINVFVDGQWNLMETNGAVFLPCGGSRVGTTVGDVGTIGYYWTATFQGIDHNYIPRTYYLGFNNDGIGIDYVVCSNGYSVRLVRNAE